MLRHLLPTFLTVFLSLKHGTEVYVRHSFSSNFKSAKSHTNKTMICGSNLQIHPQTFKSIS